MNKITIMPPPGCLEAWERAAGGDLTEFIIRAANTASGFRPSNTGITGISDSAPKRLAFRINWSESGVKKSTTMAYTKETREQKLDAAKKLLESKRS